MNFNQANVGIKSQIRRNSGIPTPLMTEQLAVGDNTSVGNDTREGKVAFIIKQRQQLDSSPIGICFEYTTRWQLIFQIQLFHDNKIGGADL